MILAAGRRFSTALLLSGAALAASPALSATCPAGGASNLGVGTVTPLVGTGAQSFAVTLGAGEGVIVDLSPIGAAAAAASSDDADSSETAPPRTLALCDAAGSVVAPAPSDIFDKGGSYSRSDDGERLKFVAPAAGRYIIGVAAGQGAREVLVRRRDLGMAQGTVSALAYGERGAEGRVSKTRQLLYSFAGTAGQWVEIKSVSEKDTLLNLAGPNRAGEYEVLATNDDSDGLNPVIRRKLPVTGTYFLQVDSLSEEEDTTRVTLARTAAPPPPPLPLALRAGATVTAKLDSADDVRFYALPVVAGHSYRIDLTATYDAIVKIGVPNPVVPDDGETGVKASFSEIKSQDTGTRGTEKLPFTASANGTVLVYVGSFGIGDTDGTYTLSAVDLGG